MDAWAYQTGVRLDFIRPGKPVESIRPVGEHFKLAQTDTSSGANRRDHVNVFHVFHLLLVPHQVSTLNC